MDHYPRPESYARLFRRFLHFGLLAWGGPVPQIAMIRQELVDREHWVSPAQFNKVLAVYQVLPGPEAHELCVYFGMLNRGRWGGFLAGLGFMLPGLILMFALSWLYAADGLHLPFFTVVFFGCKAAVAALIVRAVHRLSQPALSDRWLWAIALAGAASSWLGAHFLVILPLAGLAYVLSRREPGGSDQPAGPGNFCGFLDPAVPLARQNSLAGGGFGGRGAGVALFPDNSVMNVGLKPEKCN
ncbi:MAG: hypothetical protein C4567_03490 [Deltaproteobacteria bacterium]|nr:MAG: hypothetical protein C4567_03490 [Deltaproteobacteria bacterium]